MRIEEAEFYLEEGGTRDELTGDGDERKNGHQEDKYFRQI